ncbi:MAG TPA: PRTRC system protein F [Burkholderiales bacterium]|nr:PRTRC system protein F [Burkholderiales bacterium]
MIAAHALQIPLMGGPADCPRTFTVRTPESGVIARAALAIMDAGRLEDTGQRGSSAAILQGALHAWLTRHGAGMRVLRFGLKVGEGALQCDMPAHSTLVEVFKKGTQGAYVTLSTPDGYWGERVIIGNRCAELERRKPGLGETALWWLEQASRVVPMWLPADALAAAEWLHWHGETDEQTAVEMLDGEEEWTGVRRADFDCIPKWALDPKRRLSGQALPKRSTHRKTAAVLRLLAELEKLHEDKRLWPGRLPLDGEGADDFAMVNMAAFAVWSQESAEVQHRLADDFCQVESESGEYIDVFSSAFLPDPGPGANENQRADAMFAWRDHLAHLERGLAVMRLADALLHELSE